MTSEHHIHHRHNGQSIAHDKQSNFNNTDKGNWSTHQDHHHQGRKLHGHGGNHPQGGNSDLIILKGS